MKAPLLKIMNLIRYNLEILESLKIVNVAMMRKAGKRDSNISSKQRGIFILSSFRSILMKMLLKDEYEMIDNYMSDSNVGGMRGRRTQDHLFIINGIIFDHARTNKKPVTI